MKLRNLFLAAVAGVAALVGCNKEVDLGPAKLTVSQEQLSFGQGASSQTVTFTSTRDWAVAWANVPDWIALDKETGKASTDAQSITVSVTENKGHNRSATLTLTIGFAQGFVHIFQEGPEGEVDNGDGSLEKPYTVTGVIDYVNSLGADVTSPVKVFVKGKVSAVDEAFTTQYGNGSFKISDDGTTAGGQFTAYRVLYLGNKKFASGDKQVEVGDEVVVYGNVVNYKGNTPETSQNNAFLYSLNGEDRGGVNGSGSGGEAKGTGTAEDPFNVAAAIAKAKETGETATSESYYIKGKVGTVTEQFGAQYGNATFTMLDEGSSDAFTAYRVLYFDNQKWTAGGKTLNENDEVVVCAKIVNFKGNTPETSGGYVVSINGEGGKDTPGPGPNPGEATGTGTADDPFNIAAAIAKAVETGETATSETYYIKGIVKTVSLSAQYKNADLDLVDEGGSDVFKAFRIKGFEGADITGNEPIAAGDEVVICGNIVNYKSNTPETTQGGILVLWNGKTSFDGGEPGPGPDPGEATGTGTADDPFNIAAAIAKAVETGETATSETYYIKGIVKTVSLSAQYKNADLDLVDEGGSDVFKAFRIKGFEGADITGNEPIAAGDEVVICGNIVNYKSNTPETTQGGILVLWNGKTSFDGGEPGPGPDPGDEGEFDSNVTWTLIENAQDNANSTVNNVEGVSVLKLGTGSKYGKATLELPEGSTVLEFYAISWNNADAATLVFTIVTGETIASVETVPNSTLKGNPPFTLTVTDDDKYEIEVPEGVTEITVETTGGYRAALFGIQAR